MMIIMLRVFLLQPYELLLLLQGMIMIIMIMTVVLVIIISIVTIVSDIIIHNNINYRKHL